MDDLYADLRIRIVAALRDADDLGLMDVGIALETARLQIERAIVEATRPAGSDRCVRVLP